MAYQYAEEYCYSDSDLAQFVEYQSIGRLVASVWRSKPQRERTFESLESLAEIYAQTRALKPAPARIAARCALYAHERESL
jgi:hypothetical protein